MRKHIIAFAALLALVSCSDSEPPVECQPADAGRQPPPEDASPTHPTEPFGPPNNPEADAGSACAATEAWCLHPAAWPQDPAAYPGVDVQCYCLCDANLSGGATGFEHPDCIGSPIPSECGTIFEIVNVNGVPTKQERFPTGKPFVCRVTEFQQAL